MSIFGQNGHFLLKTGQKMGKTYFSQNFNQVIIVKDHKYSFNMKQAVLPVVPRPAPNGQMGQNGQLLAKKYTKKIIVKILTS